MKSKLFAAVAISVALTACVTPMETTETEVVQDVVGASQSDLYNRAKIWFAETYNSAEDVIDYGDPATGTIIGKGYSVTSTNALLAMDYGIKYTFRVDTKDGKMRVTTKILSFTNRDSSHGLYETEYGSAARQAEAEQFLSDLTASLYAHVSKTESDW